MGQGISVSLIQPAGTRGGMVKEAPKMIQTLRSTTRVMVYKGHREISILAAPLFLPKKPYWWPQGGPYFKTSPY